MAHRNICKTNTSANKRKDSPSLTESKVKNVGPSQDLDPEAVAYFRAKCARLEAKNAKLKEKLVAERKQLLSTPGETRCVPVDKKTAKEKMKKNTQQMISGIIKNKIWRKYKFISNDVQAMKLCDMIWDELKLSTDDDNAKNHFLAYYSEWTVGEMNRIRTYTMQRTIKAFQAWKGPTKPTVKDLEACLKRDIDIGDAGMMKIFAWYWNELLPMATGSSKLFNESHRLYATISKAAHSNKPNEPIIIVEIEAFAVLSYENNLKKWNYYEELDKEYKGYRYIPCSRKKGDKEGVDVEPDMNGPNMILRIYSENCKGKYTLSDRGQSKYGGWTHEGLKRYVKLVKMARKGRCYPHCQELEEQSLQRMRKLYGKTADCHMDEMKKNRSSPMAKSTIAGIDTWGDLKSESESETEGIPEDFIAAPIPVESSADNGDCTMHALEHTCCV